ncbi:MAG: sodium/proline symporter [Kiritimatiellae bacterium]|nr:sodium/proline symporter [Kiritimatiellia bacterium]
MQILAFAIYFAVVLVIGIYFFLKTKGGGEKEYFLGGRQMGPWVSAMSAQASDMSGWLLMGFPGSILAFGLGKVWIGIGLALGTILNWTLVAGRLRRFSAAAGDSITLPQYLTNRFASANPALKVACAIVFLVAFTIYVASGFVAGTKVFVSVFPALQGREMLAMEIFAALILSYTFLGGYKAVCWTDFFQGIMMLCALLLVPIAMCSTGRFDAAFADAFADGIKPFGNNPFAASWQDIVSGLGWGLGYFGMPHILVRFMGIQNPKDVKKSAWIACIWVVLSLGAAIAVGILGRTYLLSGGNALAAELIPASAQQMVFVSIVNDLFPAFVAGILLAAIIAAAMSTADSQLLVASSAFSSDFYQPIVRKNQATDAEMLWVGRFVVMIVAFVAFYVAASGLEKPGSWASSIMDMVENAWGLFGAAFGPVVILSLFWRRFNYGGALAGIVAGAVVDLAWLLVPVMAAEGADGVQALVSLSKGSGVYEIVPGFAAGLLAAVLATLQTEKPGPEVEAIFEKAVAGE